MCDKKLHNEVTSHESYHKSIICQNNRSMTFYHIVDPHQTHCFYSVCKHSYACVCSSLLFSIFPLENILTFRLLQNSQEAMRRCPAHPDPLHAQNPQMKV